MIAYKSPLIAVVPQTFEKQQDIIRATYALMAQQNEALRRRAEELRAVRRDLEAFGVTVDCSIWQSAKYAAISRRNCARNRKNTVPISRASRPAIPMAGSGRGRTELAHP